MLIEDDLLKAVYHDNGKGFDIKKTLKNFKGFGILNIQNRIKAIHGNIKFLSEENTGFKVEMEVNLKN
jgi:signal transduction histidine kinase